MNIGVTLSLGIAELRAPYATGEALYKAADAVTDQPLLNRRAEQFIGRVFVLDSPLADGYGQIRIGDAYWTVFQRDGRPTFALFLFRDALRDNDRDGLWLPSFVLRIRSASSGRLPPIAKPWAGCSTRRPGAMSWPIRR